jgi:hypothetical protein
MYMRVGPARMDPARIDEDSRLVQDIAEAFKQLPGFQSLMMGVDRTTGQVITVSTWDTEEHARCSLLTRTDLIARLQAVGVQGDPPEFFEVSTLA